MAAPLLRRPALIAVLAGGLLITGSAGADDKIDCDNAMSQNDMNTCAEDNYGASDARLNKLYRNLIGKLEAADAKQLREGERAWITYRDAECRYAIRENEGGSIYPMMWFGCLTEKTEKRSKELQAHLDCVDGKDTCTE